MSYTYNINPSSPFEVRIIGTNYNTLYNFNPDTNAEFQSYEESETFAVAEIDRLENPPTYEIWYHIDATGGDGQNPIGIRNDGVDALNITATARSSQDPASAIRLINDTFRMEIRTQDGYVYDVVLITFVDGIGTLVYTDDAPKGNTLTLSMADGAECQINEDGSVNTPPFVDELQVYSIHLAGETQFIVYRVI